jgi:hypothetical protein
MSNSVEDKLWLQLVDDEQAEAVKRSPSGTVLPIGVANLGLGRYKGLVILRPYSLGAQPSVMFHKRIVTIETANDMLSILNSIQRSLRKQGLTQPTFSELVRTVIKVSGALGLLNKAGEPIEVKEDL